MYVSRHHTHMSNNLKHTKSTFPFKQTCERFPFPKYKTRYTTIAFQTYTWKTTVNQFETTRSHGETIFTIHAHTIKHIWKKKKRKNSRPPFIFLSFTNNCINRQKMIRNNYTNTTIKIKTPTGETFWKFGSDHLRWFTSAINRQVV